MARFLFTINRITYYTIPSCDIPEIIHPVFVAFWRMCLYIRLNCNLDT